MRKGNERGIVRPVEQHERESAHQRAVSIIPFTGKARNQRGDSRGETVERSSRLNADVKDFPVNSEITLAIPGQQA